MPTFDFQKLIKMSYELTGKLVEKFDTVQRSESFRTREFVIEKSEEVNNKTFTSYIKFQCVQDRTAIVDRFNTGDQVKVHFNIRGTKWEKADKVTYITNLDAWRMESLMNSNSEERSYVPSSQLPPDEDVDNLPF